MDITQVYQVVESVAKQALGKSDITVTDTTWVSVGNEVLKSDTTKDSWYKALADRIGRTELSLRPYENGGEDFMRRNSIEWGAALQKLYIETPEAKENPTWFDQTTPHSDPFEKFPVGVTQNIFSKLSTWDCPITVPDVQLRTAFISPTDFSVFYNGLFTAQNNSCSLAYENMANLARATFIGLRKNNTTGITAVNLLTEYNTTTNRSLTVATAMQDMDFLKFAVMTINLYSDRMTKMSRLFNAKGQAHHTPKDMQVLTLLSDFDKALGAYLQADTYHKELVSLANFNTVPYWQGVGTDYSFENASKINITHNATAIELPYVLAILHDRDAIGTTINNRRTTSVYNPRDEYNSYFMKADIGYYTDNGENGIVFYMAES